MIGEIPIEKERKYLIRELPWKQDVPENEGVHMQQWYLDAESIKIDDGVFLMGRRVQEVDPNQVGWRESGLLAETLGKPRSAIRVRIKNHLKAKLEVKGPKIGDEGIELGWELSDSDVSWVEEWLSKSEYPSVEKIRWEIQARDGCIWELDIFKGANEGLKLAEIEYQDDYEIPDWIGKDVTEDVRLFNQELAINPITKWDPVCEYI